MKANLMSGELAGNVQCSLDNVVYAQGAITVVQYVFILFKIDKFSIRSGWNRNPNGQHDHSTMDRKFKKHALGGTHGSVRTSVCNVSEDSFLGREQQTEPNSRTHCGPTNCRVAEIPAILLSAQQTILQTSSSHCLDCDAQ